MPFNLSVDKELVKNGALIVFLLVQLFVIVLALIIRYHFRQFSLPGDLKGALFSKFMNFGAMIIFAIASFSFYLFLIND